MFMFSLEDSRNRGFVARMQQKARIPHHDEKFIKDLASAPISTERAMKHMTAWLNGWDEANIDYAKATRNA